MSYRDKEAQREYQRQWKAARRADFFKDKCCVKCGSTDRMELDHIDGATKVDHKIWSWSEKRRNEEIAKCQVLCYVCHSAKTSSEVKKSLVHGTYNAYRQWRCRCGVCRSWNASSMATYRAKKTSHRIPSR